MSVPTWLRDESETEYLWQLYKLNIRLGEIVTNHPKKYRPTYGDKLLNNALEALTYARIADQVRITDSISKNSYLFRKENLIKTKGLVKSIISITYIYLELTSKTDGVKSEKILKQEEEIGLKCNEIIEKIEETLKQDKSIYNLRYK